MSEYAFKNLKKPINTASGVAEFVLISPVYDFVEGGIKCPVAPFTDPGDEITIKATHVHKDGKAFIKILLAPEKNQLTGTTIGDLMFQKLDQSLEIFIPGSYAEVHEFVKNIINTPLIVLSKDADCDANMYYQLGCDCTFAYAKMDFGTGFTREGVKGYKGMITYLSKYIQYYKGTINVAADTDGSS